LTPDVAHDDKWWGVHLRGATPPLEPQAQWPIADADPLISCRDVLGRKTGDWTASGIKLCPISSGVPGQRLSLGVTSS
jgi:hypothetical protein